MKLEVSFERFLEGRPAIFFIDCLSISCFYSAHSTVKLVIPEFELADL